MSYQLLLFIFIVGIIGFCIGSFLKSSGIGAFYKVQEGARTLPRPTRHPLPTPPAWSRPPGSAFGSQTMNQYVDSLIGSYFDENNVPYTNTINTYSQYCVNQGNVDQDVKHKLNDVCYYILNIVLPNIPDEQNPNPSVVWPKIQWLSSSTFPIVVNPINTGIMYSNSWNSYSYLANNASALGGFDYNEAGPGSAGTGGNGSGSSTGSGTGPVACGAGNNPCGIQCPRSCFSSMLLGNGSDGSGGSSTPAVSATTDFGINANASFAGQLDLSSRLSTTHTNSVTIGGQTLYYEITDASQNYPNPPSKLNFGVTLNENIKQNILDYYFTASGPEEGRPTQAAIDAFAQIWLDNPYPMDMFHKNKLRDLVYYVMEYIIPGLPTKALPVSYVEWRPIVWLSHSDV